MAWADFCGWDQRHRLMKRSIWSRIEPRTCCTVSTVSRMPQRLAIPLACSFFVDLDASCLERSYTILLTA
eukprot:2904505-Lingulodinium_polyedra.AAC.1